MSFSKVSFVSKKISKVRWRPKSSSVFITGSYDDEENELTVWKIPNSAVNETDEAETFEEFDPLAVCSEKISGCVTDLKVISDEVFFAGTSLGSLALFKYTDQKLNCAHVWKNVHWFKRDKAALTAIAVKGQEIASVGEDGRLCIYTFNQLQKLRDIVCSDQCSFTAVNYLRHQEIVVGNSLGYLRVWDLRSPSNISSSLLIHSRNQTGVTSMTIHPSQNHVLAAGYDDGSMYLWDMRQDKQPVSILEGHAAAITELLFHPSNPDYMFTSSLDGSVLQWSSCNLRGSYSHQNQTLNLTETPNPNATSKNPWLMCETNKHRLEITSLFSQPVSSVNSIDFSGKMLLWATDNEAVYMYNDIAL